MKRCLTPLGVSVLLPAWAPALAGSTAEGIVGFAGNTFCTSNYYVHDVCTGEYQVINGHAVPGGLAQYMCAHVSVAGPEYKLECVEIDVESIAFSSPPCPIQIRNLRLSFNSTGVLTLQWSPFDCVASYDIVRGELEQITFSNLGPVTCVGENVIPTTKSLPGDPDPPAGAVDFYLVRATGGQLGWQHYGYSSNGIPHYPLSGGCVF